MNRNNTTRKNNANRVNSIVNTRTKAQKKENAIREAARIAAEKKAAENARKAATRKISRGVRNNQREKVAEALVRKEAERKEKEARNAEEAYSRTTEGRAALKEEREKQKKIDANYKRKVIKQELGQNAYDKKHKVVYDVYGNPLTALESAHVHAKAAGGTGSQWWNTV